VGLTVPMPPLADRPRWGIAATGHIAGRFATGLQEVGADLVAVGSRDQGRADAFADEFGIPRRHGSYEDLAADPAVDVVYVATPHVRHAADTLLFLSAGKHVLCEKPFALNRAEADVMVDAARAAGLFLMDAVWSRCLPSYRMLREVLAAGHIGSPLIVDADLGMVVPFDPRHRLYDIEVGGGATLDLGVYPVQLVSLVLGPPDRVHGTGHIGPTGVDELMAATLHHADGSLGVVRGAITAPVACDARITGTEGWVTIGRRMHMPPFLDVTAGGSTERIDVAHEGEGLRFEAVEVERCLAEGRIESPLMPLAETLTIMSSLDAIRAGIGMTYPGE
jgi:predicted dehydrogenase